MDMTSPIIVEEEQKKKISSVDIDLTNIDNGSPTSSSSKHISSSSIMGVPSTTLVSTISASVATGRLATTASRATSQPMEYSQQTLSFLKKRKMEDEERKTTIIVSSIGGLYGDLELDLPLEWASVLKGEFVKPYWTQLKKHLNSQFDARKEIYPSKEQIFEAFKLTSPRKVKGVIIGQDPYPGGQGNGLCFAVAHGAPCPASLQVIYQELRMDISSLSSSSSSSSPLSSSGTDKGTGTGMVKMRTTGCLRSWAEQGMLLLNTTLTVNRNEINSHASFGWSCFTDEVIRYIANNYRGLVFLVWGEAARKKIPLINSKRNHCILKASHPSPKTSGFTGCRHFSKTNEYLAKMGKEPIDWMRYP